MANSARQSVIRRAGRRRASASALGVGGRPLPRPGAGWAPQEAQSWLAEVSVRPSLHLPAPPENLVPSSSSGRPRSGLISGWAHDTGPTASFPAQTEGPGDTFAMSPRGPAPPSSPGRRGPPHCPQPRWPPRGSRPGVLQERPPCPGNTQSAPWGMQASGGGVALGCANPPRPGSVLAPALETPSNPPSPSLGVPSVTRNGAIPSLLGLGKGCR